jgi:hypothetical protein
MHIKGLSLLLLGVLIVGLGGCIFFLLLVPMDGLSSGTDEVLTSLVLGTFFSFMGFTFFVTLAFTGCSMCEGYSMKSASG